MALLLPQHSRTGPVDTEDDMPVEVSHACLDGPKLVWYTRRIVHYSHKVIANM